MKKAVRSWTLSMALATPWVAFSAPPPVLIVGLAELSGNGATPGTNFDNGIKLAVKEINASGGILGRQIDYVTLDTQSNPSIAKSLAQKAVDMGAYVVIGPVYSGSTIVSMGETRRAEVTNFTASEAPSITEQGNPYIFRTGLSLGQMFPKLATYVKNTVKARSVAIIYANNEAGKGARDSAQKSLEALGVKVADNIATEPGQVDFTAPVLAAKRSNADAIVTYVQEEESAHLLRSLKQQAYGKPVIGATVLTSPSVLKMAGDAGTNATAVVDLAYGAPQATFKAYNQKFEAAYHYKSDHNAMKGYSGIYVIKAATEKQQKFDTKALATTLHGLKLSAAQYPGVFLDTAYDDKGDLDRETFLVQAKDGQQLVIGTIPPGTAK